jgi:hypothetical protein
MGSSLLFLTERIRKPLLLALLVAVPLVYIPARVTGAWSGDNLVSFISGTISADRADSLHCRLLNEKILAQRAMERPLFGWATWGGSRVYDDQGKDVSVTDGLWIITLGCHGLYGLTLMILVILLPVITFLRRVPSHLWSGPCAGPAAALAVLLALYMVDCLLNAMINPIFMVMAGGIAGLSATAAAMDPEGQAREEPAADGEPAMAYAPRFL